MDATVATHDALIPLYQGPNVDAASPNVAVDAIITTPAVSSSLPHVLPTCTTNGYQSLALGSDPNKKCEGYSGPGQQLSFFGYTSIKCTNLNKPEELRQAHAVLNGQPLIATGQNIYALDSLPVPFHQVPKDPVTGRRSMVGSGLVWNAGSDPLPPQQSVENPETGQQHRDHPITATQRQVSMPFRTLKQEPSSDTESPFGEGRPVVKREDTGSVVIKR